MVARRALSNTPLRYLFADWVMGKMYVDATMCLMGFVRVFRTGRVKHRTFLGVLRRWEIALTRAIENKVEAALRLGDLLRKMMQAWTDYFTTPLAAVVVIGNCSMA